MESRLLRRPFLDLLTRTTKTQCLIKSLLPTTPSSPSPLTHQQTRHESSYRRLKKRLNIAPDASFIANTQQTSNTSPPTAAAAPSDEIIFNPPSSAPSVLHTPLTFLPKSDPRRALFRNPALSSTSLVPSAQKQGPILTKDNKTYQRHHLSQADVDEMRRLRAQDPEKWTSHKLAKRFNCAPLFVGMCCKSVEGRREAEEERVSAIKARWGPKRAAARVDRVRRREAVYRDE